MNIFLAFLYRSVLKKTPQQNSQRLKRKENMYGIIDPCEVNFEFWKDDSWKFSVAVEPFKKK